MRNKGKKRKKNKQDPSDEKERKSEQQQKYMQLYNLAPVGYLTLDQEGQILEANTTATKLLGRPLKLLLGNDFWRFTEEDRAIFELGAAQNEDWQQSYELKLVKEPRELFYAQVRITRLIGELDEQYLLSFIDITQQRQAKQTERTLNFIRNIVDSVRIPLLVLDEDSQIVFANSPFYEIFKLEREETDGESIYQLKNGAFDVPQLRNLLSEVKNRPFRKFELEREFPEIGYKVLSISGHKVFDEKKAKNLRMVLVSIEDITEQKTVEQALQKAYEEMERRVVEQAQKLQRADQELFKLERLESMGRLAGGIAHDFNNLLLAVLVNINLVQRQLEPTGEVEKWLAIAEKAVAQAKTLTQQLLTFSKGGNPIKKITSIAELLRDSAAFAISGSNVVCQYKLAEDLWPVEIDRGQIGQVINNIVINAVHAMPEGGTITIEAENTTISVVNETLPVGEYIRIKITDEGCGISAGDLPQIFDPYFSMKQGSGLGLSIVHSITRKHGGLIRVESQLGEGTTFIIYLPACPGEIWLEREKQIVPGGQGKILLVDDDSMLVEAVGGALCTTGYEVELAKDGKQAIELYQQAFHRGEPFDVAIIDLTIRRGIGGKETITELRKIDPQIKAIVASGYSDDPVMSDYKKYGFAAMIAKPYSLDELCTKLHEVISESN